MNDEQQEEWEKLKELMEVLEAQQSGGVLSPQPIHHDEHTGAIRDSYVNAQALAALEFGPEVSR